MKNSKSHFIRIVILLLIWAVAIAISLASGAYGLQQDGAPITLIATALIFVIQWLLFIPAYLYQTERYYDLTGSLSFIMAVLVLLWMNNDLIPEAILLAIFVIVWALRLGSFLFIRILQDGKDQRFASIKPDPLRFFVTWNMQGLWVVISAAPVFAALSQTSTQYTENPPFYITVAGVIILSIGFIIEVIADQQKRKFKKSDQTLPFITTGLWKYSRHPNYLGEIMFWFGMALAAFPLMDGWQYATLVSPVFVFLLLTRISGVPLLEASANERWGDLQEYQQYKNDTPVMVPFLKEK